MNGRRERDPNVLLSGLWRRQVVRVQLFQNERILSSIRSCESDHSVKEVKA